MRRRQFLKMVPGVGAYSLYHDVGWSQSSEDPFLLVIHCAGGWDQMMVFDASTPALADLEDGREVATEPLPYVRHASRPAVDAFFNEWGSQSCIVNGLHCPSLQLEHARLNSDGARDGGKGRWISWPTFYAYRKGPSLPLPNLVLGKQLMGGPLGEYDAFCSDDMFQQRTEGTLSATESEMLDLYISKNYANLVSEFAQQGLATEKMKRLQQAHHGDQMMRTMIEQVEFQEQDSMLLKRAKIACFAMAQGQSISADIADHHDWDVHSQHQHIHSQNFEELFQDLGKILTYAQSLQIDQRLLVVVKSDFGRGPRLSSEGGRQHWPVTSCLLWGQGVKGARSFGGVDENFLGRRLNPLLGHVDGETGLQLGLENVFAALFLRWIGTQGRLLKNVFPASCLIHYQENL